MKKGKGKSKKAKDEEVNRKGRKKMGKEGTPTPPGAGMAKVANMYCMYVY